MTDNNLIVGQLERDRIRLDDEYELRGWSEHFCTTPMRLRHAVEVAGPMANDVEAWLSSHHGGTRKPQ